MMPKITRCIIKKPRIRDMDLSSENALGFAYQEDFEIQIHKHQSNKEYLNTLIHEMFHCFFPDLSEIQVTKLADIMSEHIWKRTKKREKKQINNRKSS